MYKFLAPCILLGVVAPISSSTAQLLSVDINGSVRSDVTAPGFMPWFLASDLTGDARTAVRSFTNYVYTYDPDSGLPVATNIGSIIGCQLQQTYPTAPDSTIYLRGEYANKDGNSTSTDPNSGWRLSEDGCRVWWKSDLPALDQAYTNGGAFSLTLSNLSAGVHTVTTYHNDFMAKPPPPAWHGANALSKCIISVNGVPVYTNVPSNYATNDSACGFAFFTITNSYDGQPVVINFDPDHSSVLDFVVLNGFEIDRASPPGTLASAVFPLNADEHVFANNDAPLPGTANAGYLTLQWQPAAFAISNHVYFGSSQSAVLNATTASPEFKLASAAEPGGTNTLAVTNLNSALTYYWRVDQLNISNDETNLVKGTVWAFRTRHLAFPGAEGYGRFSRGGRGGRVIEVTNLNDSGPGSYRAAVQASGPRTVVFRVSGLIRLNGPCTIGNGYLTIAGQTAPGDGICLANWRAGITSCSDVLVRFMRVRLGDAAHQAMDGMGLGNSTHSIIDHTSLSWTMDEATSSRQSGSVGSQSAMITFQHNFIAEPLQYSYHYDGNNRDYYEPHAFAGSISGEIGSYHHNIIAHSTDRNWSLAGGLDQSGRAAGSLDIRNNVVYNWSGRTTDGGVARANYVNNYYKSFSSSPSAQYFLKADAPNTNQQYYMTGNVMAGVSGQGDVFTDNWKNGGYYQGATGEALQRVNSEFYPSYVDTHTASNAFKVVLSDSGCNLQFQDAIDRRIVGEVLDRTTHYVGTNGDPYIIDGVVQLRSGPNLPGFIDSQNDVRDYQSTNSSLPTYSPNAPWPPYYTYNVPVDTDHDGLPDWWERIRGLNTNSPAGDFSDSNSDSDGDGYTALEDYLNWLAKPHFDCTNGMTLNVDLTQYTRGFTNASLGANYAVFSAAGGTVGLSGRTAQFTPNTGIDSLGSFYFKVTDNTGFSYTNSVNVHILSDGTSVTNPPAAPANLLAAAGDAQVSLSWPSVSGATYYILKAATVDGGPYNGIATNASTTYLHTGLSNGTTYYYVVSAGNSIGEGTNSVQATATPSLPLPGVPVGLTATAGDTRISLSWSAASAASAYVVKRAMVNGGDYASLVTNTATTFTNTGLVNGTTYYYVVSAQNAAGESANSSQASAAPRISTPTGLIASAGNGQATLSWNPVSGATGYVVKRSTIGGGPYTPIVTNATTGYVNSGLANGITYYFVVTALDAGSESANSTQVSAMPAGSGGAVALAYEGFNYTAGTGIGGQTGGNGWGAAWMTTSSCQVGTNAATGLTYGSLVTSGGALRVGYTQPGVPGGTITAVPERILPTTLGTMASTNGGVLWISYLFYNPSYPTMPGKFYRQSNLGFFSGAAGTSTTGSEVAAIGSPNTSATVPANFAAWGGTVLGAAPNLSTVPSFGANVNLVVIKVVADNTAALDTYYGWFNLNPALLGNDANTPDISTANVTNSGANLSSVNALRFQAGNYNSNGTNAFFTADELRLGGSFAAVTPVNFSVPAPPTLGIRNQAGSLLIELTGETGRSLTVQSKTSLTGTWLDWTNVTGSGTMQLLPLNDLTNQSPRYFRALVQ